MIPCSRCKSGWLTQVQIEVAHAKGTSMLTIVACDTCGERASHRDTDDYYQILSTKGRNLFEEKQ